MTAVIGTNGAEPLAPPVTAGADAPVAAAPVAAAPVAEPGTRSQPNSALDDELLDAIVWQVRERFGDRLPPQPPPGRMETEPERRLREEQTSHVLYDDVMPALNRERLDAGVRVLTEAEEDLVVGRIIDAMFALGRLGEVLRDDGVENIIVMGAMAVRVEHADGTVTTRPPLVERDEDLMVLIREQAIAADRPFSYRHPFLDLQLPDGSRFHGEGFDVVERPIITIRRHRYVEITLDDLIGYGTIDDGLAHLLATAVHAGFVIVVTGMMNSGKTTTLRALCSEIDPDEVIATVETDFELGLHRSTRFHWVHAYQSRPPTSEEAAGVSCQDLMTPAVRLNASRVVVGEVRSGEAGAFVDAISIGNGAMSSVHGYSCRNGLDRLATLMNRHNDVEILTAMELVYGNVDLVVHMERSRRGRYVKEVLAPSMAGRELATTPLYGPGSDRRAQPIGMPTEPMIQRLIEIDAAFDLELFQRPASYLPLRRPVSVAARVS